MTQKSAPPLPLQRSSQASPFVIERALREVVKTRLPLPVSVALLALASEAKTEHGYSVGADTLQNTSIMGKKPQN